MEIDLDNYRHCIDNLRFLLEKEKGNEKMALSRFSSSYGIPVIVIYYYAEEILGYQDWIEEGKKSLTEFYGYEKIKGIKEKK